MQKTGDRRKETELRRQEIKEKALNSNIEVLNMEVERRFGLKASPVEDPRQRRDEGGGWWGLLLMLQN